MVRKLKIKNVNGAKMNLCRGFNFVSFRFRPFVISAKYQNKHTRTEQIKRFSQNSVSF